MGTLRRVYSRLKFGAVCALLLAGGYFAAPYLREEPFSPVTPTPKFAGKANIDYSPVGVAQPRKNKPKPTDVSRRDAQ